MEIYANVAKLLFVSLLFISIIYYPVWRTNKKAENAYRRD